MKNIISIIAIIWITISSCSSTNQSPEIKLNSTLDLGKLTLGDSVKSSIICTNLENKEVEINYIKTPCGCLTAYPQKQTIPSNGSTNIIILYKPMDIGYTEQNLFIYFSNYQTPVHILLKSKTIKQQ